MNTIGPTLHIAGEVTSDEDLAIDGTIRGRVAVRRGTLTVRSGPEGGTVVRAALQDLTAGPAPGADR